MLDENELHRGGPGETPTGLELNKRHRTEPPRRRGSFSGSRPSAWPVQRCCSSHDHPSLFSLGWMLYCRLGVTGSSLGVEETLDSGRWPGCSE